MLINRANLDILYTAYNTAFRNGLQLDQAASQFEKIAMVVPSSVSEEKYGWLGKIPSMRKWVGERVVHNLIQHDYSIRNLDFELTERVGRNEIEDDQYGVYAPLFELMGQGTQAHKDESVWPLLKAGFSTVCYDGQYFFDGDHPVIASDGSMTTVSNTSTETGGTPWFLADLRMYKPIIFQQRKPADNLVRRDQEQDDNVFTRNEFEYGVHCRDNVGYSWWQTIYGSRADLTAANYNAAKVALTAMKGDHGRPLGLRPNTLIVPPALEMKARQILKAEFLANGASNIWQGSAELEVVPWLA